MSDYKTYLKEAENYTENWQDPRCLQCETLISIANKLLEEKEELIKDIEKACLNCTVGFAPGIKVIETIEKILENYTSKE